MINSAIKNIICNCDNEINEEECFDEMFSGIANPILSGAFLTLLKAKEFDIKTLLSAVHSARNAIKKQNLGIDYSFLIENICLNEKLQYIDISFCTDIVSSACSVGIVKTKPVYYENKHTSFDTYKAFNLNMDNLNIENYENNGFLYSFLNEDNAYIKYTSEIIKALPYETILNTINCFLNPYNIKNCSLAINSKEDVEKYAQLCLMLNYNNSIVFSAGDFPFVSIEGETFVSEAWKNKVFSYTLTPELLEIKPAPIESLKVENTEHNKEIIEAIFENKLKDAFYDAIVINSALSLYITKRAKSLMEGIQLAKKTINDGLANEKLNSLKSHT